MALLLNIKEKDSDREWADRVLEILESKPITEIEEDKLVKMTVRKTQKEIVENRITKELVSEFVEDIVWRAFK